MRECLCPGTVIALSCDGEPRQFQIDSVIGDGASCVVYGAHRLDGSKAALSCRIKECYPFQAAVVRTGQELVWKDEAERRNAFQRMRDAHKLIIELRNDSDVGNMITMAELCKGNGTLYSVMEVNHAETFACSQESKIHEVLDAARVLTEVVGGLHQKGYLHLDIKPDNFLVRYRPSTSIWLFDVDSLIAQQELSADGDMGVSYSRKWAAPELKLGRVDKLCPATDLFSIGAVLFEKLMGRPVSNEDIGQFVQWELEGPLFENENPKIKRLLCEIFKKTLAASDKRRYQSAKELEAALNEVCLLTLSGKPYLKENCPPITTQFMGRVKESAMIQAAFRSGKRGVFLHGVGGIGKSTLAIAYANQYPMDYDAVIFSRYQGSLEKLFQAIEIQNFDGSEAEHDKQLRGLMDEHTLLIVDNFDVSVDADDYLNTLLQCGCKLLFTSRTDFSPVLGGDVAQIEVGPLAEGTLEALFCDVSGLLPKTDAERGLLRDLIKKVEGHTLLVELFAKQIKASCMSLRQLTSALDQGVARMQEREKVHVQKDGRFSKQTVPQTLRTLFQVANLSEEHKQALRALSLISFLLVDASQYRRYSGQRNLDPLNELVEWGWVNKRGDAYSLHPLIFDLVRTDLTPNEENCPAMFSHVIGLIVATERYENEGYEADDYAFEKNCDFLMSFFRSTGLSDNDTRKLAIDWLLTLLGNDEIPMSIPFYHDSLCSSMFYDTLEKGLHSSSPWEVYHVYLILSAAWLREFTVIHYHENAEIFKQKRADNLRGYFEKAKEAAMQLPDSEIDPALDFLYGTFFSFFGHWPIADDDLTEIVQERYCERPQSCTIEWYKKELFGLPLTESEQTEKERDKASEQKRPINNSDDENYPGERDEKRCMQLYADAPDKVAFFQAVANDRSRSYFERARTIHLCTFKLFEPFLYGHGLKFANPDWETLGAILDVELDLLLSDSEDFENDEEGREWGEWYIENRIKKIIVDAATGELGDFRMQMDYLLEQEKSWIASEFEENAPQRALTHIRMLEHSDFFFGWAVTTLPNIKKAAFAIPHLLRYTEWWENCCDEHKISRDSLFKLYRMVVNCAAQAADEESIPEEFQLDFHAIVREYRAKLDEIAGTEFELKPLDD